MRITVTSLPVSDQEHALDFYTSKVGFIIKSDIPLGGDNRWLTLVSPQDPDGIELLLEPNGEYPAMKALKASLVKDGIPFTTFEVDDVKAEYTRLISLRIQFSRGPTDMGDTVIAVFDDTCGNLIQMHQIAK